jgi:hypothetical protein
MDFVERWFGVSPDGGSGVFEACIILTALIVVGVWVIRGRLRAAWYLHFSNTA